MVTGMQKKAKKACRVDCFRCHRSKELFLTSMQSGFWTAVGRFTFKGWDSLAFSSLCRCLQMFDQVSVVTCVENLTTAFPFDMGAQGLLELLLLTENALPPKSKLGFQLHVFMPTKRVQSVFPHPQKKKACTDNLV